MNKNLKGFSLVVNLLVILLFGLVFIAGWNVQSNHKNEKKDSDSNQVKSESPRDVEPLPSDSDLAKLAKTQDQKDIAASILEYCISMGWDGVDETDGRVSVSSDIFNKPYLYSASSTNANVSASCYSNKYPVGDQPTVRQYLLHKDKTLDKWVVDSAGQDTPSCEKVDKLGYTPDVLELCYDITTEEKNRVPLP